MPLTSLVGNCKDNPFQINSTETFRGKPPEVSGNNFASPDADDNTNNSDTISNSLKVMGTKVQAGDGPSFINVGNLVGSRTL